MAAGVRPLTSCCLQYGDMRYGDMHLLSGRQPEMGQNYVWAALCEGSTVCGQHCVRAALCEGSG